MKCFPFVVGLAIALSAQDKSSPSLETSPTYQPAAHDWTSWAHPPQNKAQTGQSRFHLPCQCHSHGQSTPRQSSSSSRRRPVWQSASEESVPLLTWRSQNLPCAQLNCLARRKEFRDLPCEQQNATMSNPRRL